MQNVAVKTINAASIAESAVFFLIVITGFSPLVLLISNSNSGFDVTDEGSYLNWMSNPWHYTISDTQFGFIYHPVYLLFAGNVSLLRQANLLINTLLAFSLCSALIHKVWPKREAADRITELRLVGLVFALSTAWLVYVPWGLATPNHNSLALQSLLVSALGIVWAESEASRMRIVGWVLVGIGGWLAFMAKPTTAVALSIAAGLYLLLSKKFRLCLLSLSVGTAVLLVIGSGWVINGSISGFVDRLLAVAEEDDLLGSRNYLRVLFTGSLSLTAQELVTFLALIFAVSLAVFLGSSERTPQKIGWAMLAATLTLGGALMCALLYKEPSYFVAIGESWRFLGLLIAAVPIGMFLGCFTTTRSGLLKSQVVNNVALAFCFAMFPYVFAIGSASNYWKCMSAAGFFWVLAAIIILGSLSEDAVNLRRIAALAAGVELITVALVCVGIAHPYRQPQPLTLNRDLITLKPSGAQLVVAGSIADYIKALQSLSYNNGFRIGDPMIDLTGTSPGVLFALGARSVGYPWLNGGYPGSAKFAAARLDQVACEELSRAWLLIEPSGPSKLPDHLMSRYGVDVETDFKIVGVVPRPPWRWLGGTRQDQRLLKPIRSPETALEHCQEAEMARHENEAYRGRTQLNSGSKSRECRCPLALARLSVFNSELAPCSKTLLCLPWSGRRTAYPYQECSCRGRRVSHSPDSISLKPVIAANSSISGENR